MTNEKSHLSKSPANMQEPQTVTSAPLGRKVQVMHREEQKT